MGLSKRNLVVLFFVLIFEAFPGVVKLRWNVRVNFIRVAVRAVRTTTLAAVSALFKVVSSEDQVAIFVDDIVEVFDKCRRACHRLKNGKKNGPRKGRHIFWYIVKELISSASAATVSTAAKSTARSTVTVSTATESTT